VQPRVAQAAQGSDRRMRANDYSCNPFLLLAVPETDVDVFHADPDGSTCRAIGSVADPVPQRPRAGRCKHARQNRSKMRHGRDPGRPRRLKPLRSQKKRLADGPHNLKGAGLWRIGVREAPRPRVWTSCGENCPEGAESGDNGSCPPEIRPRRRRRIGKTR
jgi:hypothetical protein